jgi:Dicarboxylate transport
MARRWVWGVSIMAGAGLAVAAGLPALIEWQGTRLVRYSISPSAVVNVVHLGLGGAKISIGEEGADGRRIALIILRYGLGDGISARIDLDLPVAGLLPDGVDAPGAALRTTGTIEPLEGWRWRFVPDGCVTLRAERIVLDRTTMTRPESLCLKPAPDRNFLEFGVAEGWHAAVQARDAVFNLQTAGLKITGSLPDSKVEAAFTPGGALTVLNAGWRQARFSLPAEGIASDGFDGTLSIDGSAGRSLKADYAVATIRSDRDPAFFAPFRLTGTAAGSLDKQIDFDAILKDRSGTVSIAVKGRHDLGTGVGQAGVRMKPTAFGTDAAQLTALLPITRQWIGEFTGTLALKARTGWGEGADRGRAEILLKDVAVDAGAITASGVNAVVTADRLSPLRLPAGQTVSIALMDAGVPLTDGEIRFGIQGDRLSVTKAEWNWAGGLLRAAPFEAGMNDDDKTIVLEAEDIDLRQLLSLTAIEGLSASGTLRGSLPIHVSPDAVAIEGGHLETTGSGTLRYDPDDPPAFLAGDPGSSTDMLMKALTDFRYDGLDLSVDGRAGGEMTLSFAIQGSNPSFYDGYPVALNLNVGGALDTILRRGLATYRIPSTVRERMMEFQDQDK